MIKRMGLTNFKSWRELDIELGPITMLFGTNSAGKTSVLDALLALKQTAASFDRGRHFNFGGSEKDYIDLGSFRDVVFEHDTDQRITIELSWRPLASIPLAPPDLSPEQLSYRVRWRLLKNDVVIERLSYGTPQQFFRMERSGPDNYRYTVPPGHKDRPGRPPNLPSPESCYAIPPKVTDYYEDLDLLEFNRQFESLMGRIAYLGPLRDYPKRTYPWTGEAPQVIGPRGQSTIEALIAAERRRPARRRRDTSPPLLDSVVHWMQYLGLVRNFRLTAIDKDQRFYETRVCVVEDTVDGSLDNSLIDVGFGVSQVLPVVTQLFFVPEGSIVLLEQPELHLHPSAQAGLADLFLTAAQERNLQLIIESHSEHLLTRLQRRIAEAEQPLANPDDIKLYFCEIGVQGFRIAPVWVNIFGEIENWPDNFFGDQVGDLDAMTRAGIHRRKEQLAGE
jgi:predicted ATPase